MRRQSGGATLGTITLQACDGNNAPAGSSSGNPNTDGVSGTASFLSVSGTAIHSARISGVPGKFVRSSLTLNGNADPDNHQALWWASPAGSESGWGLNLTHQGDRIFAIWFTYDSNGRPWWLAFLMSRTAPGVYTGDIFTTTGPPFDAVPFDPAKVVEITVGTATLTFADGTTATFAYTVNGVAQTKPNTRQVFVPPGTVCQ